jgi:hypothetical protein
VGFLDTIKKFFTRQPVAQQSAQTPRINLGQFLNQHLGPTVRNVTQGVSNKLAQVPKIHLQGIEQLTGRNDLTVGKLGQQAATNLHLNQPAPKNRQEARAQILDPENMGLKLAGAVAGGAKAEPNIKVPKIKVPDLAAPLSSKARANMAADPDAPPLPTVAKGLPKYQMKPEGKLAKAVLPTVDIIKRQGVTGAKLGKLVDQAANTHELYQAEVTGKIPTVLKGLSRKERANFGDVVEGKAKPVSPKQALAVKEWQKVAPTIRARGLKAGLDIGDQSGASGKGYFPHMIDFEKLGKPNRFNQAVNHLVDTKQAKTPEEAVQLLNYARDVARNRPNGNLEAARLVDLPDYDKSSSALSHYIAGATKRIAHVETFGPSDEHAIKLLTKIAKEGGDSTAAKNAFDIAVGAKKYDSNLISPQTSGKIRSFNTLTKLGTAAISNATQSVNTATVAGYRRTGPNVFH